MGKFRITTTERTDDRDERATGCTFGPEGPARSLGCVDSCTPVPDTPGYGAEANDISPLADGDAQE